jgi:hypothetical protein
MHFDDRMGYGPGGMFPMVPVDLESRVSSMAEAREAMDQDVLMTAQTILMVQIVPVVLKVPADSTVQKGWMTRPRR